jgi:hypothetical protein
MMTYRVGACASPSAGKAMAEYYLAGTLKTELARAAEYYAGAQAREERAAEFWRGAVREGHLAAAGTVAELRPDLSPALAARLGIFDSGRPLTQAGIANLLNATRLDGEAIAGRGAATNSTAERRPRITRRDTAQAEKAISTTRRCDATTLQRVTVLARDGLSASAQAMPRLGARPSGRDREDQHELADAHERCGRSQMAGHMASSSGI